MRFSRWAAASLSVMRQLAEPGGGDVEAEGIAGTGLRMGGRGWLVVGGWGEDVGGGSGAWEGSQHVRSGEKALEGAGVGEDEGDEGARVGPVGTDTGAVPML